MKSMSEQRINPTNRMHDFSYRDTYAPKRVRWPGLLGAAVVLAVVVAGVMVTGRDDGNRPSGAPDRATPSATQRTAPRDAPPEGAKVTPLDKPTSPDKPTQP